MATYEELIAKSKELAASGDVESAKRVAQIALKSRTAAPAKKPLGQTIKENLLGDDDPDSQNWGEYIGSTLNKAGEAMTFGLVGDEASAAAAQMIPGGMDYDERLAHERQQERVLERDNPGTALGADVGGAVLGALLPGGAIGTLGKGAGMGARMGASAAVGAGMGGTYGAMEGEGLRDRLKQGQTGAVLGGALGAATPVIGAGVQKMANNRALNSAAKAAARNAPSTQELKAAGRAAYQKIDDAGVQIKPQSFDSARKKIMDSLLGETGFDPLPGPGGNTPKAARVMQTMDEMMPPMQADPSAALPFKSLDQVRRRAASPMLSPDMVEQSAGANIVSGLDDYVRGLGADDVVAGDVKTLQETLPKARDLWARMSRSQLIDDATGLGEEAYLSGSGTGIKYQFKRILKNSKLRAGFSEAERKMMARVVNGSVPEQVLRLAGSGLATIGGSVAALAGGSPLAALGVVGATRGARALSDKVVQKNAELVRALVANGGLEKLPIATDAKRKLVEALMRRGTAAIPQ